MQTIQIERIAASTNFKSPAEVRREARRALVRAYRDEGRTVRMIRILLRRKHGIDAAIGTIAGDLKGTV